MFGKKLFRKSRYQQYRRKTVRSVFGGECLEKRLALSAVPPAPTIFLANDTGFSSTDRLTYDGSLVTTGVLPGALVEYSSDGGMSWATEFQATEMINIVIARQTADGIVSAPSLPVDFILDYTSPWVWVSASSGPITQTNRSTEIIFTLNEDSTDFTAADVLVTGGTLSHFTSFGPSYPGPTYRALFNAAPGFTGTGTISIEAGSFTDWAGNGNTSSNEFVVVDAVAPQVSITSSTTTLNVGEISLITFTLSEDSTTFELSDVVVFGGTVSDFRGSGSGYTATFTATPQSPYTTEQGYVYVEPKSFTDLAGNYYRDQETGPGPDAISIEIRPPHTPNSPPSDLSLSATSVAENRPAGTIVGTLDTTDPDVGDTFTYTLVSGIGDADNASFEIVGNQLRTKAVFDYETKNTFAVRVRSTDINSLSYEEAFAVRVINLGEGAPDLAQGLIARFRLDSSATDSSGNGRHGSMINTVPARDRFGSENAALYFNGIDSFVTVPHHPSLNALPFTISLWFQTTATNARGLVGKYEASGWNGYQLSIESDGTVWPWYVLDWGQDVIGGYSSPGEQNPNPLFHSSSLNDGIWHNLVFTVDSSGGAVFVDGVLQSTKGWRGQPATVTTELPLFIGRYLNAIDGFFKGIIDDVSLYDRVLSPTEVALLSNDRPSDVNGRPTDLVLSATSIYENSPAGSVVGGLSTIDPDAGDSFTYTLVAGVGDADNASFEIAGNQLRTKAVFDYDAKNFYSVRVRSTDSAGLTTEKALSLGVTQIKGAIGTHVVDARQSVSFAGVPIMNFEGPEFEGIRPLPLIDLADSATRPVPLDVTGLSHIDISASGFWGIQQGSETGPAGNPTSLSDTTEAYPAFGISGLRNAPLSLLVGVFVDGTLFDERQPAPQALTYSGSTVASPALSQAFPIGALSKGISVPNGATRLYLGIHDGYEWVNNVGTIAVMISRSPAAPTNVGISSTTVAENLLADTAVGTLHTTDLNTEDTFTYTLVSGTGDTDNASFAIVGNELCTKAVFDYEIRNSYSVRVRTTDQGGLFFEKSFTITVTNVNETPTNVTLSGAALAENAGVNKVVGTLSSTDPDASNTFTFTLVPGTGSTDNAAFNISGNQLRATAGFDFEAKNPYSIRVRTTDQGGLTFEKAFTIMVTNVNEAPTNIALSSASIAENGGANAVVGTLSSTDPDAGNTFTYSLVPGTGSTDNAAFNISGNQLRATASLNFEAKNSYSVRVRTTDQGGLFTEKAFTITVTNVNEAPTNIALSSTSIAENAGANAIVGTLSSTDPDASSTFSYVLVSGTGSTDNSAFNILGNQLRATASFDFETKNSYSVRVRATDQSGMFFEKSITLTVNDVAEAPSSPTSIVGTPGNGFVTLTWDLASNGGSPVTDYVVQFKTTAAVKWSTFIDGTSSSRTATVTGLTNGVGYVFRVAAVNVVGVGAYPASSAAVTPRTVPSAPLSPVPTLGNRLVSLRWAAPKSNGGAEITDCVIQYRATTASTWTTFEEGVSTSRSATVTGLTNGVSYVFRVAAKNAAGTGAFSAISRVVTPRLPTLGELLGGRR